jgi:GNAT superfamily N-acetyltransferase
MPSGVEVRPSGEEEFDAWLDVVADGFAHPDTQGVPSHEDFPREVLERAERDFAAAGVVRYVALRDGVIAGGGSFRMAEGVAQLAGAATAHAHRRRGVQSALLSARLGDAAATGCGHRRRHHAAGIQVSAERAASGLRLALYPRRASEELTRLNMAGPRGEAARCFLFRALVV